MKDRMTAIGRVTLTTDNAIKKIKMFSKGGMKYAICLISPEVARELLKLEVRNRARTPRNVNIYARYMTSDIWKLSPWGIAFNIYGHLIDGGHRLDAIIKANRSEEFIICCGCDPAVQTIMDQGNSRTTLDVLQVEPKTEKDGDKYRDKTTKSHVAVLGSMILDSPHSRKIAIPKLEKADLVKEYFEPIDDVLKMYEVKAEVEKGATINEQKRAQRLLESDTKVFKTASVVAPIVRAYEIYKSKPQERDRIKGFVQILTGMKTDVKPDEQTASKLRIWIAREIANTRKITRPKNRNIYKRTETALSLYMKKENCSYLTDSPTECFPMKMTIKLEPYLDPFKGPLTRKHGGKRLTRKPASKKNIYIGA